MKTEIYIFVIAFILPHLCYSQNLLQYPLGILYDSSHHRYLIANRNGDIIQIDNAGHQSYFMQGTSMSHGLVLIGNTLYGVNSTNPRVTGYDMETGNQVFSVNTNEPRGFSGIAADSSGNLYVTNHLSNYGKIIKIRISSQTSSVFAEGNSLSYTTGIIFEKEHDRLVVCSFRRNYPFWAISVLDSTVTTLIRPNLYECFGLIKDKYGRYYVTAEAKYIYRFDSDLARPPEMVYRSDCWEGGITALCYNQVHNQIGFAIADCNTWDLLTIYAPLNQPTLFELSDSSNGIMLRWQNPSRYSDSSPLDSTYYVLIYKDGTLLDSIVQSAADTGQRRTYFDAALGYHTYRICLKDADIPPRYSDLSDSLLGYGGIIDTVYNGYFDEGAGKIYRTGRWDTTSRIAYEGKVSITDSPHLAYAPNADTYFLLPPIAARGLSELKFHQIAIVLPVDTAIVEISQDNRKTFYPLGRYNWDSAPGWNDNVADPVDWRREAIPLSGYSNDTITIRFRLRVMSTGILTAEGWYVDYIYLGPAMTEVVMDIRKKWNMVSLPVRARTKSLETIFPTASSLAYRYDVLTRSYEAVDSIEEGVGYWLKFPADEARSVEGFFTGGSELAVRSGWNLLGSVSVPIGVVSIASEPPNIVTSRFYTYMDGYVGIDTIRPGTGYWIKVSQEGKLLLSSEDELSSLNRIITISDNETPPLPPDMTSSVDEKQIPTKYRLYQNYPNPFNPSTNIRFDIPTQTHVRLEVFNVLGSLVKTLLDEVKNAGSYSITWDGTDNEGNQLSTGLYYCQFISGNFYQIQKALLIK